MPKPSLQLRNAGMFGLAYLCTVFGYEFIFFIMLLRVYHLGRNALNVSIFTVLTFLPRFLSSYLGVLSDRFKKETVLGWVSITTAALLALLTGVRDILHLYILWFLIAICLTFITNIRASLMAEVVPGRNYSQGNSALLIFANGARLLTPLLGGWAATALSWQLLLGCTALVYVCAAACCRLMLRPQPAPAGRREERIGQQIRAGLQHLWQDPALRFLVAVGFLWRLFLGLQTAIFIIYVKAFLFRTDFDYGVFMTVIGVGSIAGSLLGSWMAGAGAPGRKTARALWGLGFHYVSFAVLGVIHDFYAAAVIAFFSFGAFYAAVVALHTVRDHGTPAALRGRVYGLVTTILTFPAVISLLAGGFLAQRLGAGNLLLGAGAAAALSLGLAILLLKPFRSPESLQPASRPQQIGD